MPIVDSEGRLFGRVNLLDAVLGILLLVAIPLAYGAYLMFRTPPPRLISVEPAALVEGPDLRVHIRGENLRPYMRVSFNDIQGNSFIFRNTSEALVDLNPMPPGVYDVVLYDNAQERARLPQAFTLNRAPLPASEVMLVGTLGNLTAERAAGLEPGMTVEGIGRILEVAPPLPEVTRVFAGVVLEIPLEQAVRVPIVLRAACAVRAPQGIPHCTIGDANLQISSIIVVKTPIGPLPFQVDQIRGLQPLEAVTTTVQFTARREIVDQVRQGDADLGQHMNPLAAGAVVKAIANRQRMGGDTDRVDVTLTAQAQRGASHWIYGALPLRPGSVFYMRTPRYELQGTVIGVQPEWSPPGATPANGPTQ